MRGVIFCVAMSAVSMTFIASPPVNAQSSCSAANDNQDQIAAFPVQPVKARSAAIVEGHPQLCLQRSPRRNPDCELTNKMGREMGFVSAAEKTPHVGGCEAIIAPAQTPPGPTGQATNVIDVINSKLGIMTSVTVIQTQPLLHQRCKVWFRALAWRLGSADPRRLS